MNKTTLTIKNAKKLFPSNYFKVREEDFMTKMDNKQDKTSKQINSAYDKLFNNKQGISEYLGERKGNRIKFTPISP